MAVGHNTGAVRENPGMPRERGKRRERPPEKKKIGFFHDKTAGAVDMPMLVITLVLLVLGITMMFSASHALSYRDNGGDSYQYATRQLFFAGAGLIAMFFLSLVDYRIFIREWHPKLFGKVRTITLSHVALVVLARTYSPCNPVRNKEYRRRPEALASYPGRLLPALGRA